MLITDQKQHGSAIVLEYMEGGEVKWKDTVDKPILPLQDARSIFRDVVLGLEYRMCPSLPGQLFDVDQVK
jgi:serine/threonine protein kinase